MRYFWKQIFCLYASGPYSKFFFLFFKFFSRSLHFKNFCVDWAYAEQVFCCQLSKIFCVWNVHFGYFSEISILCSCKSHLVGLFLLIYKYFNMRWLSLNGNDFIAFWVNVKTVSSLTVFAKVCARFFKKGSNAWGFFEKTYVLWKSFVKISLEIKEVSGFHENHRGKEISRERKKAFTFQA